MIHAYLFILNVREGNGGHGPNFCRIMTNINKAAGTNITVSNKQFFFNHLDLLNHKLFEFKTVSFAVIVTMDLQNTHR